MSTLQNLLTLVGNITPENRQALIVCLLNQTGPLKLPLTSDFGANGLSKKVTEVLDGIAEKEIRIRRTAELLKWLSEEHCAWMVRPQPVDA